VFGITEAAPPALAEDKLDVFVGAPAPSPFVPFFATPKAVFWQFAVSAQDMTFAAAMTSFLQADLFSGAYGKQYQLAFSAPPDYRALTSLLFPLP
jgi:hypothetical protein